jgi:hypothetical protein
VAALPEVQNFKYNFSLPTTATLDFTLRDYYVLDNGGGISLKISQIAVVPEPVTGTLMVAGLGVVGLCARRRRRS